MASRHPPSRRPRPGCLCIRSTAEGGLVVDFAWLYIAVALLCAGAAVFLRVAVKGQPAKQRIWAWLSVIVGVVFFLLYVTKIDRDVFVLVLGLVCRFLGAHPLLGRGVVPRCRFRRGRPRSALPVRRARSNRVPDLGGDRVLRLQSQGGRSSLPGGGGLPGSLCQSGGVPRGGAAVLRSRRH